MGLFKNTCRPAKTDPVERDLTISLPPPDPTRKTIHNLTKTSPPQDLLITNDLTRDRFPGQTHLRINSVDLGEDSYPGQINDHVFVLSGTHI
jgi:hypothetical protein